jgi:hypothetical protein
MQTTQIRHLVIVHHDATFRGNLTARKRSKVMAVVVQLDKPYTPVKNAMIGQTNRPDMNNMYTG